MAGLGSSADQRLRRLVQSAQRDRRLPSLVLSAQVRGEQVGTYWAGTSDFDRGLAPGADVQYRVGSITKTVTAVAVMQLIAAGRLALHDELRRHWPDAPHGDVTILSLLTHTSGLQAEPVGEVWETLMPPSRDEFPANAAAARRLYPAGTFWHYSNLGFALLGELVARVYGAPWEEVVTSRILEPLGMMRTTMQPAWPHASGYSVAAYADAVQREPHLDSRAIAPAAQLWSTVSDLATWSHFLLAGDPQVLDRDSMAAMRVPRVVADLEGWSLAWGLGLMLVRDGGNVYVGHTGSMPGFLAACFAAEGSQAGVALLTNSTASTGVGSIAAEALRVLDEVAREPAPWQPGPDVPEEVAPLLGRWWSEWREWIFSWTEGQLVAKSADAPSGSDPERYSPIGHDLYLCISGPGRGEELRIVRSARGDVEKMYRATYPMTRRPEPFGGTEKRSGL